MPAPFFKLLDKLIIPVGESKYAAAESKITFFCAGDKSLSWYAAVLKAVLYPKKQLLINNSFYL